MKKYLRSVVEEFPHAAAEGYHAFGWRGSWLAFCAFVLRRQPFPISLPHFGSVASRPEATNLLDNFALDELRSDEVEDHLRRSPSAWVVDVGVNIGVTCRWWLSLSPSVHVAGVDMFQEALDYTTAAIGRSAQLARWHPICAAVGDHDGTVEVQFSDPLEGTSSIGSSNGNQTRRIQMQTLDELLSSTSMARIGLLKLDIEGSAGHALRGAAITLSKCDYVTVETHSDEETSLSSRALIAAGFHVFHVRGRTIWWRKNP